MPRFIASTVLTAAVFVVLAAVAAPANATVSEIPIVGEGTISPGLTVAGGPQTFTFAGTGVVISDSEQVLVTCFWTGDDTIGTIDLGSGNFSGNCTDGVGTAFISGSYTRSFDTMSVTAEVSGGGLYGTWIGDCQWYPTTLPPITTYSDACMYTVVGNVSTTKGAFAINGAGTATASTTTINASGEVATTDVQSAIQCTITLVPPNPYPGVSGTCTDADGSATLSGYYLALAPDGGEIQIIATANGAGITGPFGGHCALIPTNGLPATTFQASCEFTFD